MMSKAALKIEPISMMPVCTTFVMVSQIPEKKATMPFQMPSKKVLIFVQTSLQLVPNQPRNTSTMPWMMPTAAERTPLIPSHTPEKIV